ncbi:hypothetical protein [Paraburkholderia tropica]|uniref:hypothetical protein n=1 Tax=Paraburkholderia tropica TaxID=92647 RepID=UPI003D2B163A
MARAKLFYVFHKNKDGSTKSDEDWKPKMFDSFTVSESDVDRKGYFITYEMGESGEVEVCLVCRPEGIYIKHPTGTYIINVGGVFSYRDNE